MITKGFMEVVWHGLAANQYTPLTKVTLCGYRFGDGFNPRTKVTPDPSRVNCEACILEAPEWIYVGHPGLPGTKESPKLLKTLTHSVSFGIYRKTDCGIDFSKAVHTLTDLTDEATCPACEKVRSEHAIPNPRDLTHREVSPESGKTLCGLDITTQELNTAEDGGNGDMPGLRGGLFEAGAS